MCDVVDGVLHVNRDALAAASGRLNSAKGISPIELSEMKAHLRGFYDKLGLPYPASIQKSSFVGHKTI